VSAKIVVVALLFVGSAGFASASPEQQVPAAEDADPMVCRRPEPEVGTRLRPAKVCKPKSVWEAAEGIHRDAADDHFRRHRTVGSTLSK
jgi:hypothetical protein